MQNRLHTIVSIIISIVGGRLQLFYKPLIVRRAFWAGLEMCCNVG